MPEGGGTEALSVALVSCAGAGEMRRKMLERKKAQETRQRFNTILEKILQATREDAETPYLLDPRAVIYKFKASHNAMHDVMLT